MCWYGEAAKKYFRVQDFNYDWMVDYSDYNEMLESFMRVNKVRNSSEHGLTFIILTCVDPDIKQDGFMCVHRVK